eukprot:1268037-Pyramimonas_sp.AAC.1
MEVCRPSRSSGRAAVFCDRSSSMPTRSASAMRISTIISWKWVAICFSPSVREVERNACRAEYQPPPRWSGTASRGCGSVPRAGRVALVVGAEIEPSGGQDSDSENSTAVWNGATTNAALCIPVRKWDTTLKCLYKIYQAFG